MRPSPVVARRLIPWYSQEELQKHRLPRAGSALYRNGEVNVCLHSPIQLMMDGSPESSLVLSTEDLDKHLGQGTASPERQFVCDGWCHTEQPSETPEHCDVVCWVSSHPFIPRIDSPVLS